MDDIYNSKYLMNRKIKESDLRFTNFRSYVNESNVNKPIEVDYEIIKLPGTDQNSDRYESDYSHRRIYTYPIVEMAGWCSTNTPCPIRYLLKIGANVNKKDTYGNSALHAILKNNWYLPNLDAIKMLVKAGIKINSRNEENYTPLEEFIKTHKEQVLERGFTEVLNFLLSSGAKVRKVILAKIITTKMAISNKYKLLLLRRFKIPINFKEIPDSNFKEFIKNKSSIVKNALQKNVSVQKRKRTLYAAKTLNWAPGGFYPKMLKKKYTENVIKGKRVPMTKKTPPFRRHSTGERFINKKESKRSV